MELRSLEHPLQEIDSLLLRFGANLNHPEEFRDTAVPLAPKSLAICQRTRETIERHVHETRRIHSNEAGSIQMR
jgi:hypothetical protein